MKKSLVFIQGTIGDTIVSIPALRLMREALGPSARIEVLHETHPHLSFDPQSVLNGLGLVDGFVTYRYSTSRPNLLREAMRLWRCVRGGAYESLYYLIAPGRSRAQLRRDQLFFRLAGVRNLFGFSSTRYHSDTPFANVPGNHEAVLRARIVGESCGVRVDDRHFEQPSITLPDYSQSEADDWLARRSVASGFVAIGPGAKKRSCLWPLERWTEVVQEISATRQVVVVGGKAESEFARMLQHRFAGRVFSAAGELSVLGTGGILKRARVLLGLDTGTTHLAAAVGCPTITAFAAQDVEGKWVPIGRNHIVIRTNVACAGCKLKHCDKIRHHCMEEISSATMKQHWRSLD